MGRGREENGSDKENEKRSLKNGNVKCVERVRLLSFREKPVKRKGNENSIKICVWGKEGEKSFGDYFRFGICLSAKERTFRKVPKITKMNLKNTNFSHNFPLIILSRKRKNN